MTIDISRKSFKPRKHYSGVIHEQGRVQLDADFNEAWAIADRRRRAATVDMAGRCRVSRQTPNGFRIAIDGGNLTIERGRMSVDGLLADNPGQPTLAFDSVLAERAGTPEISLDQQPFPPAAGPAPLLDGVHLIYLDVWRRYVTSLEDPDLVETAVGVPTTSRVQTVWQVKILPNVGRDVTCSTPDEDIHGWADIIQSSAGRLSTGAADAPIAEDPCLIPPTGGYSGLENLTYLLQIHTVDDNGNAFFKWARHNASFATSINAIPSLNTLLVESTQRDSQLSFEDGNWVEINDEPRELAGEPGILRRISVDHATGTVSLDQDLPAGLFPTLDAEGNLDLTRRTRVRRWNQSSANGLIPVPAPGTSMILEENVQVTFDLATPGGRYRTGDYWSFYARTANGSVEELVQAPPHGFHHHHCRLALVETVGGEFVDVIEDCRPQDELEAEIAPGCCTVIVRPGEDIQAAIDSLPADGGCVCLKTGLHETNDALRIETSNVKIHGESPGTRIRRIDNATVLSVGNPGGLMISDVIIISIQFEFDNTEIDGSQGAPLLNMNRCDQGKISGCNFLYQRAEVLGGIRLADCTHIRIEDCDFETVINAILATVGSSELVILNNRFEFATGEVDEAGILGVHIDDVMGPCRIEGNYFNGYIMAIALNPTAFEPGGSEPSRAIGSIISRNRITQPTISIDESEIKTFAIDVAASDCVIKENRIRFAAPIYGGIRVSGHNCRIEDNSILFNGQELVARPPIGIQHGFVHDEIIRVVEDGRIIGNRLVGPQNAIIAYRNDRVEIAGNRIESERQSATVGLGIFLAEVDRAYIADNRVTNALFAIAATQGTGNRLVGNELRAGGAGVTVFGQNSFDFNQNRIEDMRQWGFIGVQFFAKTAIADNRFISCGYEQTPAVGIGLAGVFGELQIQSCEVLDTGIAPNDITASQPHWGIIGVNILEGRIQSNVVTYTNPALLDPNLEDRSLWLRGILDILTEEGAASITSGFSARVLDNKFVGTGLSAMVEIHQLPLPIENSFVRFERVSIQNNLVKHFAPTPGHNRATIKLAARNAIVMGNHIVATTSVASVDFQQTSGIFLGNSTTAGAVNFSEFPSPESSFNIE